MPLTALVVGALSLDLDPARPGAGPTPGGVVVHAGIALARLGARVRVVTRARRADAATLTAPLLAEGIEVVALPSRATTTCLNDYTGPVDRHELLAVSDPIGSTDVPAAWRTADVVQLGPLHPDDLRADIGAGLRGLRGLDLQGLVRGSGTCALPAFLAGADVIQVSESDLPGVLDGAAPEAFAARHGVRELVVTRGARGVTVLTPAGATDVPAPAVVARSLVGAGDVFLAAYLTGRAGGRAPVEAAARAVAVVARALAEGEVPRGLPLG